ncbi:UNVERIFIED_CONTAM: hypothetical protein Scaly_2432500 [Sesamum calycinum]|uniref:GAG-pre-integrase domain-containing protein n=1 Tax=Sesamum calycinum TaxID=2727403 RepID=A0AAW2M1K1_9LAMI
MTEGSFVQSHGVKILSVVEKLEDLKAGLDNNTYIDVILQSLPPSYDPFIINYNMNGFEKSIHELINMSVQYEATTHKSAPMVFVGEASTSEVKGKRTGRWKRKKVKEKVTRATASAEGAPAAASEKGKGKGKVGGSRWSNANDMCMHCRGKGHWKREYAQLLSNPGIFVIEVLVRNKRLSEDEMILRLGDGKAVSAEAVGSLNVVISDHIRIELKDCYYVPSMIKNIISIPVLDNNGYAFKINKNSFHLMINDKYHLLGTLVNGLYILQQSNLIMTTQHKRKLDNHENAQLWHARQGHISKDRIRKLVDLKSLEIEDFDNLPTCESCLKGKMTKRLSGDKLDSRSSLCRFIGYLKKLRDTTSMIHLSKRYLSRGKQYSWKRVFLRIADEMRCYLRNRVNHLSKTTQHHLNVLFPLVVFQSSVNQSENLDHLRGMDSLG